MIRGPRPKMATVAVGNKRLLKLAAFLRKLPKHRFNYSTWTGSDWAGSQDLSCGTTACAFGWAATMPAFRRLGLRLDNSGAPVLKSKIYRTTFSAIDILFGPRTTGLFIPRWDEHDKGPVYVARKIEKFVKSRT